MTEENNTIKFVESIPDTPDCISKHMGIWMCQPDKLQNMFEMWRDGQLPIMSLSDFEKKRLAPLTVSLDSNGIATMHISGVMQKGESKTGNSTSTLKIRRAMRMLDADSDVLGVIQIYETPGGHSAGTRETYEDNRNFSKPLIAFVDDLCASAGLYAACGCDAVYINKSGEIGSIGTYVVLNDYSGKAEKEGIKVHVLSTGKFKGAGYPGTEITSEQLEHFQEIVNKTNQLFLEAVSEGRNMPMAQVKAIADGRVFMADDALELGLVDHVMSFDAAYHHFLDLINTTQPQSNSTTQEHNNMDAKALKNLSAKFGSDAVLEHLQEDGSVNVMALAESVISAKSSEIVTLTAKVTELQTANTDLQSKVDATKGETPLVPDNSIPPKEKEEKKQDVPIAEQWNTEVKKHTDDGMTVLKASDTVRTENPELYEAYAASFKK